MFSEDNNESKLTNHPWNIQNPKFVTEYEASFLPPGFTIKELRACIPPQLFEKSLLISATYVAGNLFICGALFYLATFVDRLPSYLALVLWPIYWWFQGVAGTGLWVLGHECGHQAFSNSRIINHTVGIMLHSLLLVPYHSWRISHGKHHAFIGQVDRDQVFVPKRRRNVRPQAQPESPMWEAIEESPLYVIFNIIMYLSVGWPAYLIANKSGQRFEEYACHFLPSSPIFEKRHRNQVIWSNVSLIAVLSMLGYASYSTSLWTVAKYYGIPYFFVNAWLVAITLLQHTDVYLPRYASNSWNFVRGALATVDRDYGWFLNNALHHIHDSHVAHHLFSQMPHYNAIKATPYLKKKLGLYYHNDRTPLIKALYRVVKNCRFVEDSGDVLFYRKK